jgi:hypothetical protein
MQLRQFFRIEDDIRSSFLPKKGPDTSLSMFFVGDVAGNEDQLLQAGFGKVAYLLGKNHVRTLTIRDDSDIFEIWFEFVRNGWRDVDFDIVTFLGQIESDILDKLRFELFNTPRYERYRKQ